MFHVIYPDMYILHYQFYISMSKGLYSLENSIYTSLQVYKDNWYIC